MSRQTEFGHQFLFCLGKTLEHPQSTVISTTTQSESEIKLLKSFFKNPSAVVLL